MIVNDLSQGHEDSAYVLSFEIGEREGGFYSARTDTLTDRLIDPASTVLVYRWFDFYPKLYALR